MRSFAAEPPDDLPEDFIGLAVIGNQFMSEIIPRLHFGLFHAEGCRLSRLNIPRMQKRCVFFRSQAL